MKLTPAYLRKLILEEIKGGQPEQKQPQAEDVLTKNLNLFVSNTSQVIRQATNEPQVLDLLRKIIGSLKLNRDFVSRSLITLGREMSVQPKGER
jgi:hypothetical protein